MTEETQLQFAVQPLSGPTRGGTSLQVTLHQPALAGMWALHLGGVPLNCTTAGSSTLRCCCTPTVDNSTRGSELVLYRSAASTAVASLTSYFAASSSSDVFEFAHSPAPFRYYPEPRLLKLSPLAGDARGEAVTVFAQGWPLPAAAAAGIAERVAAGGASVAGGAFVADGPLCRFGSLPPVPATVLGGSVCGTAGCTARLVCHSPDFGDADGTTHVTVAPNGLDFLPAGLVFKYAPQPWLVLLVAFLVLLSVLLLLRMWAGIRRELVVRGYLSDAPAHWPRMIGGYVVREGYASVSQHATDAHMIGD